MGFAEIRNPPSMSPEQPKLAWNMTHGGKQRKTSFPPANPAQIMRAAQKDSTTISFIAQEVTELLREMLRNNPKRENIIQMAKRLSHLIYYGCTSLSGLQTLGEEYSGILMISSNDRIPSKLTLSEMVLLKCFGDLMVTFLVRNGFLYFLSTKLKAQGLQPKNTNARKYMDCLIKDTVSCFPLLNTGVFYLTGDYYDISKRLTGIRYVLVHIWLRWKNSHSGFKVLGVVSLLNSLTQIVQAIMKYNNQIDVDEIYYPSQSIGNSNDESRCSFCFDVRKNPTITPCGHLFCWSCIMHALQVDNKCPLCRESVSPSRVVVLKNYS
ncbi:peroxisome biogenesis factor 10 [Anabrus simplex]|uniref:peroxisome biogenesis factor 10 n=1 Tax=Anabrus simplex TaxID=316456 RepID=UPI0035A29DD1